MIRSLTIVLALAGCAGDGPIEPRDSDRDGYPGVEDCDDRDPFTHPGAAEFCDGIDNDCDGEVDEDDALGQPTWRRDADGDGFGPDGAEVVVTCDPGPGWGDRGGGDCDDGDPTVYPGAPESCDGVDEDCNGLVDDDPDVPRYEDVDGDGWGDDDRPVARCDTPGSARRGGDCDDGDAAVNPGAPEVCNGRDDDCDDLVDDEDAPLDPPTWHPDADGDGYAASDAVGVVQCDPPNPYWALALGDCDDGDPLSHPGAVQRCAPVDHDCDGVLPDDASAWWDPDWPVRVPITLTGSTVAAEAPWSSVDVDLRAALDAAGIPDPVDPDAVAVVVQDCVGGARRLDAGFTDGLSGLQGAGDPVDTVGDEVGAVHWVYDRVLEAGESVELAVYLGGPVLPGPADPVTVSEELLEHDLTTATFDPSRGGLLDDLVPAGGPVVASQADAFEGNGVHTDATGWLSGGRAPGTLEVLESQPLVGAVRSVGTVAAADASTTVEVVWWLVSGRAELRGAITLVADDDTTWTDPVDAALGLRPLQLVSPGLVAPSPSEDPAGRWIARDDGAWGVAAGWTDPPALGLVAGSDGSGSWLSANDVLALGGGPVASVGAGVVLVDGARVVLWPHAGPLDTGAWDALLDPPGAEVGGPPEAL